MIEIRRKLCVSALALALGGFTSAGCIDNSGNKTYPRADAGTDAAATDTPATSDAPAGDTPAGDAPAVDTAVPVDTGLGDVPRLDAPRLDLPADLPGVLG